MLTVVVANAYKYGLTKLPASARPTRYRNLFVRLEHSMEHFLLLSTII
jgi:hypothetical protein